MKRTKSQAKNNLPMSEELKSKKGKPFFKYV